METYAAPSRNSHAKPRATGSVSPWSSSAITRIANAASTTVLGSTAFLLVAHLWTTYSSAATSMIVDARTATGRP